MYKFTGSVFLSMTLVSSLYGVQSAQQQELPSEFAAQTVAAGLSRGVLDDIYSNAPVAIDLQADDQPRTSVFNEFFGNFIKEMYNHKDFSKVLSRDAYPLVRLLSLCSELNLEAQNSYVCLRLFYNKIKACEIIDDTVVLGLLNQLPPLLEQYCAPVEAERKDVLDFVKKHVHATILNHLVNHISVLVEDSDRFVTDLNDQVTAVLAHEYHDAARRMQEQASRQRLASMAIRFFDLALSKIAWNMYDVPTLWSMFTRIASAIGLLVKHQVVQHSDDLDDLFWTHLYGFNRQVLEWNAELLTDDFFEVVEQDIESGAVLFLEMEEQDQHIATKKELFLQALWQAKVRMYAKRMGLQAESLYEELERLNNAKNSILPDVAPRMGDSINA